MVFTFTIMLAVMLLNTCVFYRFNRITVYYIKYYNIN